VHREKAKENPSAHFRDSLVSFAGQDFDEISIYIKDTLKIIFNFILL
jgi:hypothetical protein